MEILIAAVVLSVALVAAASMLGRARHAGAAVATAPAAPGHPAPTRAPAAPKAHPTELDTREQRLAEREAGLEAERRALAARSNELLRELERVSGLTAAQAKALLLKELEEDARHDRAKVLRHVEEETKRDAERRVRSILAVAMQRLAASHAAETTVSVVQLQADDMKGRIIGREGRNIRALENLTGVDFIIDDTPNAVVLSGFDGVRREIARMTLEKLLQDGRIHPARIEEMYYQAKSELDDHMLRCGEDAAFEAKVQGLDP